MSMSIIVYRYGHRLSRDKRITTHVGLVARTFGADGIIIDNKDENVQKNLENVVDRFGGDFSIKSGVDWKKLFRNWKGKIVHLTMYGQQIDTVIDNIMDNENLLVVVGAEKVPGSFYDIADYNVAVSNQPHSEVAALALFLHYVTKGKWHNKKSNGVLQIVPCKKGKKMNYDSLTLLKKTWGVL